MWLCCLFLCSSSDRSWYIYADYYNSNPTFSRRARRKLDFLFCKVLSFFLAFAAADSLLAMVVLFTLGPSRDSRLFLEVLGRLSFCCCYKFGTGDVALVCRAGSLEWDRFLFEEPLRPLRGLVTFPPPKRRVPRFTDVLRVLPTFCRPVILSRS